MENLSENERKKQRKIKIDLELINHFYIFFKLILLIFLHYIKIK